MKTHVSYLKYSYTLLGTLGTHVLKRKNNEYID